MFPAAVRQNSFLELAEPAFGPVCCSGEGDGETEVAVPAGEAASPRSF